MGLNSKFYISNLIILNKIYIYRMLKQKGK